MNLLFIGDIVGKGGRHAVRKLVPDLRQKYHCAFVIANGENAAGGSGLNARCVHDLWPERVDVITSGDHVWSQKSFEQEIVSLKNVLRPANVNAAQPGKGFGVFPSPAGDIAVINLIGRVFMKESAECPFMTADAILKQLPSFVKAIFVDFHAEATSEKIALARYLDGRVTAVIGTHTHVQTADARVFPGGAAYLSDVGMVGAEESVLGREIPDVLRKFTTGLPSRLRVVEEGLIRLDACVIDFDRQTGKAKSIQPLSARFEA